MVLYLAYKAPKNAKDRSLIPKRLRALRCVQLRKSFWKVEEEKAGRVLRLLQKNRPVLLKRIREIRKPQLTKGAHEFGSLVIVMYETTNEAKMQKLKSFWFWLSEILQLFFSKFLEFGFLLFSSSSCQYSTSIKIMLGSIKVHSLARVKNVFNMAGNFSNYAYG